MTDQTLALNASNTFDDTLNQIALQASPIAYRWLATLPMRPPFPPLRTLKRTTASFRTISLDIYDSPSNSLSSPIPPEFFMYSLGSSFRSSFTPIFILLISLGITFWVCDGKQFSQATRVVCGALTCMIAIFLGIFVYSGYSSEYAAGVILFESFFLAIQFTISHVAHAAKTPS